MGGFFGVVSDGDGVADLYYGTDYHSHLGTMRGGLAVSSGAGFTRIIHDITNAQFRSKFADDLPRLTGALGIGVISDYEDQPLIIRSHHGTYGIVTVGKVGNLETVVDNALATNGTHFSEMTGSEVNPTQLVAHLIDHGATIAEGIRHAQETVEGSCSLLLMTDDAIYAARDRLGRTPVIVGERDGARAVTMETCALTANRLGDPNGTVARPVGQIAGRQAARATRISKSPGPGDASELPRQVPVAPFSLRARSRRAGNARPAKVKKS